ncbi:MAG: hypothetical protein RIQ70_1713 [Bacteroidota bacterium]|jgi:hypothetical protein
MKKLIAIFLIMIYTAFSTGLTVYSHYCAGKLVSVSLINPNKGGCGKCGKKMTKDCCKDTQQTLSLDESQLGSNVNITIPDYSGLVAMLPSFSYEFQPELALVNSNAVKFYVFETGPPKTPIYIQIRSLLI